jgi:hypothetical protein
VQWVWSPLWSLQVEKGLSRPVGVRRQNQRELVRSLAALYLHAVPRVFPLRTYNLPDIGDHLIHFTGRTGGRFAVPDEIRNLTYPDRLAQILHQGLDR